MREYSTGWGGVPAKYKTALVYVARVCGYTRGVGEGMLV